MDMGETHRASVLLVWEVECLSSLKCFLLSLGQKKQWEENEHLTNHIAPHWVISLNFSRSPHIPWIFHNSGHLNMLFPLSPTSRLPPIHQNPAQMSPALCSFPQLPNAVYSSPLCSHSILYLSHEIYFSFKISMARIDLHEVFRIVAWLSSGGLQAIAGFLCFARLVRGIVVMFCTYTLSANEVEKWINCTKSPFLGVSSCPVFQTANSLNSPEAIRLWDIESL